MEMAADQRRNVLAKLTLITLLSAALNFIPHHLCSQNFLPWFHPRND